MQPLDLSNTRGHAMAFYRSHLAGVYEYDAAEDGPEVDLIRRILPVFGCEGWYYAPGTEGWLLRVECLANKISQRLYSKQYRELSKDGSGKRAANVRRLILAEGI